MSKPKLAEEFKTSKEIVERLSENEPEALTPDGFEDCVVGIVETFHGDVALLSKDMVIAKMIKRDRMSYEDALEFFDFNIKGAYMGDHQPVYLSGIKRV